MKSSLRKLISLPFRILPPLVVRRIVQVLLTAISARGPADTLRALLQIESDVSGQIDLAAARYGDGVHVKHRLMAYHTFFVERVRPGERVLDIGCGTGAVAYSLATQGCTEVIGVDIDGPKIEEARRRYQHPGLTFVHGDAFGDMLRQSFDVVVLSNVLEHIERRGEFLTQVRARFSPRSVLIRVPMYDRHWYVPLRAELGLFHFSDPTHYVEYTLDSFSKEMTESELRIAHLQVNWGEIWAEVVPDA